MHVNGAAAVGVSQGLGGDVITAQRGTESILVQMCPSTQMFDTVVYSRRPRESTLEAP